MEDETVQKARQMKLASLKDLLRLVVSIMGRSSVSGHLYYSEKGGKHIYFLTHSVGGWYNLKGLPITLMAYEDAAPEFNFIEYKYATDGTDESYKFVNEIKQTTQSLYIPIIKLEEAPEFML